MKETQPALVVESRVSPATWLSAPVPAMIGYLSLASFVGLGLALGTRVASPDVWLQGSLFPMAVMSRGSQEPMNVVSPSDSMRDSLFDSN